MKILAFGASSSKSSINKKLASYAANQISDSKIDLIDLNDYELPFYSEDTEKEFGFPAKVHDFIAKIEKSDYIIISLAEHNGSYTAVFKNLLDWSSRVQRDFFQEKPMILLSTSPGEGGACSVLKQAKKTMLFFSADIKASLSIPHFYENCNAESGEVTNPKLNQLLLDTVSNLKINE